MTYEDELYPAPVVPESERASKEQALRLMQLGMPTFDAFVDITIKRFKEEYTTGKGAITPEVEAVFDRYRETLLQMRELYDAAIVRLMTEQLDASMIAGLADTFERMSDALARWSSMAVSVGKIGSAFQSAALEPCPEMTELLTDSYIAYASREHGWETIRPESADGWQRVDAPVQAEEYVPAAPEEEAELERIRSGDAPA